ncbi:hypothetical protein [Rhizobium laguerreae]|uniref:hypothetical protein n=1 Tax=Rhizobium laguerreae TaxID=1076926 RepID=UPI001C920C70|nr:hypothetical protein [Rhizobium laguerreae]MBY3199622.1 hypothetical protein [Rhizobium laguerreae]
MNRHHIVLTAAEQALVDKIDLRLDIASHEDGHAIYLANRELIPPLLKSLADRSAIPAQRVAYWTDPKFRTGRMKGAHRDIFARNGSKGIDAYTHPHFIPFLRYFLFGADLPAPVIAEFEQKIGDPRWFGGSDIIGLAKETRAIVRRYNLRHYSHSDEFHKLAIDNGLSHDNAESVRKAAVEAARR